MTHCSDKSAIVAVHLHIHIISTMPGSDRKPRPSTIGGKKPQTALTTTDVEFGAGKQTHARLRHGRRDQPDHHSRNGTKSQTTYRPHPLNLPSQPFGSVSDTSDIAGSNWCPLPTIKPLIAGHHAGRVSRHVLAS